MTGVVIGLTRGEVCETLFFADFVDIGISVPLINK